MAKGGIKGSPDKEKDDIGPKIFGTEGDDELLGSDDNDFIDGRGGDDIIFGLEGNDILNGGDGGDTIDGGPGNDIIRPGFGANDSDGGTGIDTLWYANLSVGMNMDLEAGTGTLCDGGGDDGLGSPQFFSNFEIIWATKGDDVITGSSAGEEIHASFGDDVINAGGGDDIVDGGNGDDDITGGAGSDTLIGGQGADIFRFSGSDFENGTEVDTILDFGKADSLSLDGLTIINVDTSQNVGGSGKKDTILTVENDAGDTGQIILFDYIFDCDDAIYENPISSSDACTIF